MTWFDIRRDSRGVGAVEFALAAPVFILIIIGAAQLGRIYFADADLRNSVATGARMASVFPRPSDEAIIAAINGQMASLDRSRVDGPFLRHRVDGNGFAVTEIDVRYSLQLDFIFFSTPPIVLTEQRKVFTQPLE